MPGGDGTGPFGTGGRCTPYIGGKTRRYGAGRGFGRGRGMGMGAGRFMYSAAPITKEEELGFLEEESKLLELQATEIKKRLQELRKA